jgi:integrase
VMLGALRLAVRDRLLVVNPAAGAKRPTAKPTEVNDLHAPCWSGTEARQFLKAAKEAGPQPSALFSLAIDTGARKGELLGLRWADVDLEAGLVRIHRQLDGMEEKGPLFGPTKTKRGRTVEISAETVTRLRLHKSTQAELKLKNRRTYRDYGLVFAKQPEDLQTQKMHIGDPADTLCERAYDRLITAAGLRRITFHGLRHTCATLLLQAGTPVTTVSKRLGHSTVSMTLNIYSHVMPGDQAGAAATMGGILY